MFNMMFLHGAAMALCAVCGEVAGSGGWLGRAVAFQRGLFVNDVQEVAPVQIQLSVERGGAGYRDSGAWDYSAVARLLALVGASAPAPQRRALRRALRPRLSEHTRRFISKQDSWKLFPSLNQDNANEIYYDSQSTVEEDGAGVAVAVGAVGGAREELDDDAVVVLRNPVEARLPSAQISIRLLREILEARALAARAIPSTTRSTIPWFPMNKSSAQGGAEAGNATSSDGGAAGEGNGTTDAAGGGGTDGAGGAATGAGTDAGAGGQTGAPAAGETPAGEAAATEAAAGRMLPDKAEEDVTRTPASTKKAAALKPAKLKVPAAKTAAKGKVAAAKTVAKGKVTVAKTVTKGKVAVAKTAAKGKVAAARTSARAKG